MSLYYGGVATENVRPANQAVASWAVICNTSSQGVGLLQPLPGFSVLNNLYPYIYYQCIAKGLFFLLTPK